jgi:hypothetical protein
MNNVSTLCLFAIMLCIGLLLAGCSLSTAPEPVGIYAQDSSDDNAFWLGEASSNPMPLGGTTSISYGIGNGTDTRIEIINALEQEVWSKTVSQSGTVNWDGKDKYGRPCPTGLYFFQIARPGERIRNKLIIAS